MDIKQCRTVQNNTHLTKMLKKNVCFTFLLINRFHTTKNNQTLINIKHQISIKHCIKYLLFSQVIS